jgi:hypothetical protein
MFNDKIDVTAFLVWFVETNMTKSVVYYFDVLGNNTFVEKFLN